MPSPTGITVSRLARLIGTPGAPVLIDVEDVFWSHHDDRCTFDTMMEGVELRSAPPDRRAVIVRGADASRHDLAPEAAGLLAASLGLSGMYRDDLKQLQAAVLLYDAFYRWSRDATDESHDWPPPARS